MKQIYQIFSNLKVMINDDVKKHHDLHVISYFVMDSNLETLNFYDPYEKFLLFVFIFHHFHPFLLKLSYVHNFETLITLIYSFIHYL